MIYDGNNTTNDQGANIIYSTNVPQNLVTTDTTNVDIDNTGMWVTLGIILLIGIIIAVIIAATRDEDEDRENKNKK
jgi:hypothetical protein